MKKSKIYVVFDRVANVAVFTFTADNDELAKRLIRSALQDPRPNAINTDTLDKQVFNIGEFDPETLGLTSCNRLAFPVEEVRQEIIEYISGHIELLEPALDNLKKELENVRSKKEYGDTIRSTKEN